MLPEYTMSTITRRRVAGSSHNSDEDGIGHSSTNKSPSTPSPSTEKKIAYDPREIDESKTTPKLTLMEEVLLLGLKDKQVNVEIYIGNFNS